MPTDPARFIITVKSAVVFINTAIFAHYLRMRHQRYLDEWIGSLLYLLSDIVDIGLGMVMVINARSGEDKAESDFIYCHIFNRAVFVSGLSDTLSGTLRNSLQVWHLVDLIVDLSINYLSDILQNVTGEVLSSHIPYHLPTCSNEECLPKWRSL